MERMIKDHRSYRSGIPDLTVWNCQAKEIRLIEVKGPGDRLSTKQILWIRFLNSVGIKTEVCHVVPTGSKGVKSIRSPTQARTPKKSPAAANNVKSSLSSVKKKLELDEDGETE